MMPPLPQSLEKEAEARWQAVQDAVRDSGRTLPEAWPHYPDLLRALAFSNFVARQCAHYPELLADLIQSNDLHQSYGAAGYQQRLDVCVRERFGEACVQPVTALCDSSGAITWKNITREALQRLLRLFRRREMVRIAIRDICGWADLDQTLNDLSTLADTCIGCALDLIYRQQVVEWGVPLGKESDPQQLVVLGLGKLGARELNFSSDVDLLFAYAQEGRTQGGKREAITNEDFFLRLCRELILVISAVTADGFVFRVDTRLRPYGEVGPLAFSFDKLEDYYQTQGREWERYALIKARVSAGDQEAGGRLLERLKPFIFRRYLDYGAFESLRDMKARIVLEVRNKGLEDNIKLGPGGIREVEFFGQMFQLIRGGVEPALQISAIRKVIKVLVKKHYIPALVAGELDQAYVFLRTVENRLQQCNDQQVHRLPVELVDRLRLSLSLGFGSWETFLDNLNQHRRKVQRHFNDLLAPKEQPAGAVDPKKDMARLLAGLWQGVVDKENSREILERLGYTDPDKVLHLVNTLREDRTLKSLSANGRERLNRLLPLVLQAVSQAHDPELVLGRTFDLIKSIQRRASYLALLLENPAALTHLVRLSEASPWIAAFLSRHPVLLDELLDARTLYMPPVRKTLSEELRQRVADIDPQDLEYQMEVLRVFKQVNVLRVAASDVTDVLPLMKVSDHLSDIAEILLEKVVALSWQDLSRKYGAPLCKLDHQVCDHGFTVIAYGKLGGLELGYGSDLDLVFMHAAEPGNTTGGARSLDNALFFSRLGQRVLHFLTTHTSAGILYEADMRLRPSGISGMLVSHVNGFRDYQLSDAWVWEHQALIRARAITGDPALKQRFEAIRKQVLTQVRDEKHLRQEVAQMRVKLRQAVAPAPADMFDIKQGLGGIVDIEFLVQYLVLRHARQYPEILRWTDNVRLLQSLNETGILDDTTAFGLRRAYLVYRAMVHRLNLKQQPAKIKDDRFNAARRFVVQAWNNHLAPPELAL